MTRQNLPELRLMLHTDKDHGYLTARISVVQVTDMERRSDGFTGEVENIRDYPSEPRYGLRDLSVSAQVNRTDHSDFYAWQVSYWNLYRVDLRELEPKVKTLRQITRAMDKLDSSLGRPTDFPAFVGRFAHVLGATTIGRTVEGARNYREGSILWMDVDGLRYWLDKIRSVFQP